MELAGAEPAAAVPPPSRAWDAGLLLHWARRHGLLKDLPGEAAPADVGAGAGGVRRGQAAVEELVRRLRIEAEGAAKEQRPL